MKLYIFIILFTLCNFVFSQQQRLFWTGLYKTPLKGTIQSSDSNGQKYVKDFIKDLRGKKVPIPRGIALDLNNNNIYWADLMQGVIYCANLDERVKKEVIAGLDGPVGLALDTRDAKNVKLYWTEQNTNKDNKGIVCCASQNNKEKKVLASGLNDPADIALDVDAGKIYWVETGQYKKGEGRIACANLDGRNINRNFITGLFGSVGLALDIKNKEIYWSEFNTPKGQEETGLISKANLNGKSKTVLLKGLHTPLGIALDFNNKKMFWTQDHRDKNSIWQANFDGSAKKKIKISHNTYAMGYLALQPQKNDIVLKSFTSLQKGNIKVISWETSIEIGVKEFHVWRSAKNGKFIRRLTSYPINAKGVGSKYTHADTNTKSKENYNYKLEVTYQNSKSIFFSLDK